MPRQRWPNPDPDGTVRNALDLRIRKFRMLKGLFCSCLLATSILAQDPPAPPQKPSLPSGSTSAQSSDALKQRTDPAPGSVSVAPGTRILLSMINSVSTKQALVGDRIYLETA